MLAKESGNIDMTFWVLVDLYILSAKIQYSHKLVTHSFTLFFLSDGGNVNRLEVSAPTLLPGGEQSPCSINGRNAAH